MLHKIPYQIEQSATDRYVQHIYERFTQESSVLIEAAYRTQNTGSTPREVFDIRRDKSLNVVGFGYLDYLHIPKDTKVLL